MATDPMLTILAWRPMATQIGSRRQAGTLRLRPSQVEVLGQPNERLTRIRQYSTLHRKVTDRDNGFAGWPLGHTIHDSGTLLMAAMELHEALARISLIRE